MLIRRDEAIPAKRDLHIGGTGSGATGTFAAALYPGVDLPGTSSHAFVDKARDVVHSADEYVRHNPWAAVGLAALAAVTAGYFLSRRY